MIRRDNDIVKDQFDQKSRAGMLANGPATDKMATDLVEGCDKGVWGNHGGVLHGALGVQVEHGIHCTHHVQIIVQNKSG